jgi:uncharacterized protein (TIGR01440 family)
MMTNLETIVEDIETILSELVEAKGIGAGHLVVIGTSTSEVMGKHIGTAGAEEVAEKLYNGIEAVRRKHSFDLAFQCCEHLNRALVVDRSLLQRYPLIEVSAVPVAKAGGSMAAHVYRKLAQPCLVESIQADAGIDIGDTFIGMHLRAVAVPIRPSIKQIGAAHVTMAYSRPKLIGGPRAVYQLEDKENINDSNHCL